MKPRKKAHVGVVLSEAFRVQGLPALSNKFRTQNTATKLRGSQRGDELALNPETPVRHVGTSEACCNFSQPQIWDCLERDPL